MSTALVSYAVSDMERMARAFAASKLFGVQNPEQALALCLVAQAEGRHPASAAQDYHIINGRPSKKADAMFRDFLAGGGKVEWHALDDAQADATFSHPAGGTARISWDHARAKKAGISNPMWNKYPRQMLRSRVVSEGVRTVYPMATSGMYVPEEEQDIQHERQPAQEPATAPALADLRDVTPETGDGLKRGSDGRMIPAEAKRQKIHEPLVARIDAADAEDLEKIEAEFSELTKDHPAKWLDGYRDRIEARRRDLPEAPVDWDARDQAQDAAVDDDIDGFPGDRRAPVAGDAAAFKVLA